MTQRLCQAPIAAAGLFVAATAGWMNRQQEVKAHLVEVVLLSIERRGLRAADSTLWAGRRGGSGGATPDQ
jgi:hypothetical protein